LRVDRQEEFLRTFLRHEAEIRAFTRALVRDRHVRDDVFQEVTLVLWREFERYDPARPFAAWARGIAANKIMQQHDKQRRGPVVFSPEAIQSILDAYQRTEESAPRSEALDECLEKLPDKSRRLLALRYEESLRPQEIAARAGGTVDGVYKALSRLRLQLEECIEKTLADSRGVA
jgi:RNA polymerase sigma-70 factor (ECF subfamily)